MSEKLLQVKDLRVKVEEEEILRGIDLEIGQGETHVLMGPNGAGKSTLAGTLMGDPRFAVTGGTVFFRGEDLLARSVNERAGAGIFLSFQNPVEVPGISLENFIRTAYAQSRGEQVRPWAFRKEVRETLKKLGLDETYADRDLNVGFSGGEKKKAEILQMLLLKPRLAILDETDSGLDVDAVRTVSRGVEEFRKNAQASLLIITHNAAILKALQVDRVHVLIDGKIAAEGGPEMAEEIQANGFAMFDHRGCGK